MEISTQQRANQIIASLRYCTPDVLAQHPIAIEIGLEAQCGLANLDVRAINNAPILVQGRIVQEGICLYERDKNERMAFEVLTRKKYFDYLPTAELMQQAVFDSVREKG